MLAAVLAIVLADCSKRDGSTKQDGDKISRSWKLCDTDPCVAYEVTSFAKASGYSGSLAVSGWVGPLTIYKGDVSYGYELSGIDPACTQNAVVDDVSERVAGVHVDACAMRVHEGTSCTADAGDYYKGNAGGSGGWKSLPYVGGFTKENNGKTNAEKEAVASDYTCEKDSMMFMIDDMTGFLGKIIVVYACATPSFIPIPTKRMPPQHMPT